MNIFLKKMMVLALSVLVAWGAAMIPSPAAADTLVATGNAGGGAVANHYGAVASSNAVLTVITLPANIIFSADFESGNNGFIYVADTNATSNLWHRTSHRFASASHCQYYGLEDNWNYNTANLRNAGMLQSPTISLANVAAPITL